jgi:transposase
MKLVKLVLEKGLSIRKAGRRLSIKPSTAKLIIKKFKETGTVEPKNRQKIPEQRE